MGPVFIRTIRVHPGSVWLAWPHETAQREMVASLRSAFAARQQRIILSGSSINWVKWTVLFVQAGLTMLTIAMVHSDNRAANRIILAIFATGVGVAVVLIASYSRPFSGEIAVRPTVLLQVMPEGVASVREGT